MKNQNPSNLYNVRSIDDDKIKSMIKEYNKGKIELKSIIEYLSSIIYSFPKITSRMDDDACSDFFEYILVRIEKIISQYKIMDCQFLTWFTVVLRRHFYNWIKANSKNQKELAILNKPLSEDSKDEIISKISYQDYNETKPNENIVEIIDKLPPKIRIIIKLHYFDFFNEDDLIDIHENFEIDMKTLISKFHKLKEKAVKRVEKVENIQERLGKAYLKFIKLREKKNKNTADKNLLLDLEESIKKVKNIHNKELNKLKKSFIKLKNKEIGDFLGITSKKVANLLFRGKKILKENLQKLNIV